MALQSQSQTGAADTGPAGVALVKAEREPDGGKSRKRTRPASDSAKDMVDELLPAAAAMKRRKLEMEKTGLRQTSREQATPLPVTKPKQMEKEIDVREAVRKQREAEEEAERRERVREEKAVDEIERVKPAKLVVVEEMPLRVRTGRPAGVGGGDGGLGTDRWDEKWNGRKNFKKFRRQGETTARPRRNLQNVMVPLVEVKKHSYGIGEQYWDHNDSRDGGARKKKGVGQMQSQPQSEVRLRSQLQTPPQVGDHDKNEEDQTSARTTRLQEEAAEIVGVLDLDSPRQTRLADKTQSQNARPTKRPATGAGAGAAKRQKTIQTRPASDESDSDDLKFRFGRRKNV